MIIKKQMIRILRILRIRILRIRIHKSPSRNISFRNQRGTNRRRNRRNIYAFFWVYTTNTYNNIQKFYRT